MSTLGEIERAIADLTDDERRRLRQWLDEFEEDAWDGQIEEDVAAGKLDWLAEEGLKEHRAGRTRPL